MSARRFSSSAWKPPHCPAVGAAHRQSYSQPSGPNSCSELTAGGSNKALMNLSDLLRRYPWRTLVSDWRTGTGPGEGLLLAYLSSASIRCVATSGMQNASIASRCRPARLSNNLA